jgi:hypothetical protein
VVDIRIYSIAEDNHTYRRGLLTTILVDILLDTARLTVEFTYNNTGSDGYTVFLKTARNRVKFTYNNSGGYNAEDSLIYRSVSLQKSGGYIAYLQQ